MEKTLYLLGGPMGVGKTATGQALKRLLPACVYLDGDWCWDADPFQVTEETKEMVQENICFLLNQFLRCSAYENVVFAWVLHRQDLLDTLLAALHTEGCRVRAVSLVCTAAALRARLEKDVAAGLRQPDVIARALDYLPLYGPLRTEKLDVTELSPAQAAVILRNGA